MSKKPREAVTTENADPQFEILLEHLKRNRGFDFTGYKRSSLMRRVSRRLAACMLDNFVDYVDYLEVHPQEFQQLFNTILINVTSFFRDKEAWDYLASEIVPKIIANNHGEIRVWSAGCASGLEAFTIAMIFCELLGQEKFHQCVKIYATDIDEEALMQARSATFSENEMEDVPEELRKKYFLPSGSNFTFRPDLRRSVIFGRHDLVQDAPISKLDLLVCRNTLMYLNAETQARILARLHFALKDEGYLFLGKAEMLLSHANLFNPVELRYRMFTKANKMNLRDRLLVMAQSGDAESINQLSKHLKLREISFDKLLVAQVVVDTNRIVLMINEAARKIFGLSANVVGNPLQDLELSYRPVELRSLIETALNNRQSVKAPPASYLPAKAKDSKFFEVEVIPLSVNGDRIVGASIIFNDVSAFQRLYDDLKAAQEDLETTNEELQSTNEELETTNEELQSTNEELETSNEELQSTNEELETTNEELQSTNEELASINSELCQLTDEVDNSNLFLKSILASMTYGIIVLNQKSEVLVWNKRSEELWGLRSEETLGQQFFGLDIGLPVKELRAPIEEFQNQDEKKMSAISISAIDRKGRKMDLQVRINPLTSSMGRRDGIVLLVSPEG